MVHKGDRMDVIQPTTQSEKAKPKPPDGMDPDLLKLGNNLVTKFHVLMRISQIYDSKNVAIQQFVQESLETINRLIKREGILSLKIVKDDIFLNEQRLRYSVEGFTSFKYLLTQWKKRLIGEVLFKELVDEGDLREFLYTLMSLEEGREEKAALFTERLMERHISSIEVNPLEVFEGEEGAIALRREDSQTVAGKAFFETIGTIKE